MPKIIRVHLTPDQLDDLNARARRRDLTPRERERLEMIRLSHLGVTIPQIAAHLDGHPQTVRRIIRGFLDAGFAILPDQPRPGRPLTLTEEVLAAVEQRLDTECGRRPHLDGAPGGGLAARGLRHQHHPRLAERPAQGPPLPLETHPAVRAP